MYTLDKVIIVILFKQYAFKINFQLLD